MCLRYNYLLINDVYALTAIFQFCNNFLYDRIIYMYTDENSSHLCRGGGVILYSNHFPFLNNYMVRDL